MKAAFNGKNFPAHTSCFPLQNLQVFWQYISADEQADQTLEEEKEPEKEEGEEQPKTPEPGKQIKYCTSIYCS